MEKEMEYMTASEIYDMIYALPRKCFDLPADCFGDLPANSAKTFPRNASGVQNASPKMGGGILQKASWKIGGRRGEARG